MLLVLCNFQLGDFGLIRIGANARSSKSMTLTSNPLGTPAYTAPEGGLNSFSDVVHIFQFASAFILPFCLLAKGHRGDISVKLDTFSFGVVNKITSLKAMSVINVFAIGRSSWSC